MSSKNSRADSFPSAPTVVSSPSSSSPSGTSPRRSGGGAKEMAMMMVLLTAESTLLSSRMSAAGNNDAIVPAAAGVTSGAASSMGLLGSVGACVAAAAARGSDASSSTASLPTPSSMASSVGDSNSGCDSGSSTPLSENAMVAEEVKNSSKKMNKKNSNKQNINNNNEHLLLSSGGSLSSLDEAIMPHQSQVVMYGNTVSDLSNEVTGTIFSFLPWRDAASARAVCKKWDSACQCYNCTFYVMPSTGTPSVFVYAQPEQQMIFNDARCEAHVELYKYLHRTEDGQKWACSACGYLNGETRVLCGSRSCQQPHPSHRNTARLFVGQLRREGTVPYVRWLLEDVVGTDARPVRIKTVENHRDAQTRRGKGCCWVYLEDAQMAAPCADVHRRVFADEDACGREGVWIVPEQCCDALAREVQMVAYAQQRSILLPRGALVVERPVMTPGLAASSNVAAPSAPRYNPAAAAAQAQARATATAAARMRAAAAMLPVHVDTTATMISNKEKEAELVQQQQQQQPAQHQRARVNNPYSSTPTLSSSKVSSLAAAFTEPFPSTPISASTPNTEQRLQHLQLDEAAAMGMQPPAPRSRGSNYTHHRHHPQQQQQQQYARNNNNNQFYRQQYQQPQSQAYAMGVPPAYYAAATATPAYYY